jgi:FkbM family methyltransferase
MLLHWLSLDTPCDQDFTSKLMFISYAQNHEDVMLWRALKHIQTGYYIDIGAWHPEEDSTTKAFYDRGWRGINVEPNSAYFKLLEDHRERDTNLQLAIASRSGTRSFTEFPDTGLSTLDHKIARKHEQAGFKAHRRKVSTMSLAQICKIHLPANQDIHFLKVDVEGFEAQVLASNNWKLFRPWILIIEATVPLSQQPSHQEWAELVEGVGYRFAYWDGLNRFYVAQEHENLLDAFSAPPNVFDGYTENRQVKLSERAEHTEANLARTQKKLETIEKELSNEMSRSQMALASLEQQARQIANLEDERLRLTQKENEQQAVITRLEQDLFSVRERTATTQEKTDQLKAEFAEKKSRWKKQEGSLIAEKRILQDKVTALAERVTEEERCHTELTIQLETLKQEVLQLNANLEDQKCQAAVLQATMSSPVMRPAVWLESWLRQVNGRPQRKTLQSNKPPHGVEDPLTQQFLNALLTSQQKG